MVAHRVQGISTSPIDVSFSILGSLTLRFKRLWEWPETLEPRQSTVKSTKAY